jgi:hypothetical protein
VTLSPRPLVMLLPVRLGRPIPWGRLLKDWTVQQAAHHGVRSCVNADLWAVVVYHQGVTRWRYEPTQSCGLGWIQTLEDSDHRRWRLTKGWYSLRRVPLLWWPRGR